MKDKEELDWIPLDSEISLGEERDANEEEEDFLYNHEFVERIEVLHAIYDLREIMYPESKEAEEPAIMDDVDAFRYGFKYPESAHRNLTKSTLSKILKKFMSPGLDSLFVTGNVKFLARLFDIEAVREQVRAYLTSPYTIKGEHLIFLLENVLKNESRLTQADKQVVTELLRFLQE